jgi:hypothetical protein
VGGLLHFMEPIMSDFETGVRRPGRPPKSAVEAAPVEAVEVATEAPVVRVRPVEVKLQRRYCPAYILEKDGSARPNTAEIKFTHEAYPEAPVTIKLHPEDAQRVLSAGGASATINTFKGL